MMGIYSDDMMSYLHHVSRMTEHIMDGFGRSIREPEPPPKTAPKKKAEE
jgi:hypothetical protein